MNKWLHNLWLLFFIILGVIVIILGSKFKAQPKQSEIVEFATKAKFISAPKLVLKLSAKGDGYVKAANTWDAVAEVSGKVIYKSDKLKDGIFVNKGEELLEIDPSSYQLNLAQIDAQLETSKIKDNTTKLAIKTRSEEVSLLEKELSRLNKLLSKHNVSQSSVDSTQRSLVNAKANLQSQQSSLKINRAEREVLKIQRQQAENELNKTSLIAPMDVRIREVSISDSQYANRGQNLFIADAIDRVEIEFKFPIGKLRPLVMSSLQNGRSESQNWKPGVKGLLATVSLSQGDHVAKWDATITRVSSTINPKTQTLGIIAEVEKPYDMAKSGKKPPLLNDLFVEVEIHGKNTQPFLVIPSSALHQGKVYVINEDSRLKFRTVKVAFHQQGYAVIEKGLKPSEKIITSDIIPAIEGMLLKPVNDKKTLGQLWIDATGKKPSKKNSSSSAKDKAS